MLQKKGLIIVLSLIVFNGFAPLKVQAEDVNVLFKEAGAFYSQSEYSSTIDRYEKIIRSGEESAAVYFNLANAYYKINMPGKAVLNYERALQLSPRDGDINYNYKYVKNRLATGLFPEESNVLKKVIKAHGDFYSIDEMVLIIALLSGLMGVFIVCSVYFDFGKRIKITAYMLYSLLFCIFLIGLIVKLDMVKNTYVVVSSGESKFEPREKATTYFEIKEGELLSVIKKQNEWLKIKRFDGKIGWVNSESIEKL